MLVNVEPASSQIPKHLHTQQNQHDPDSELEDRSNRLVLVQDGLFEGQYDNPQDQQWRRVTQAPRAAGPAPSRRLSVPEERYLSPS